MDSVSRDDPWLREQMYPFGGKTTSYQGQLSLLAFSSTWPKDLPSFYQLDYNTKVSFLTNHFSYWPEVSFRISYWPHAQRPPIFPTFGSLFINSTEEFRFSSRFAYLLIRNITQKVMCEYWWYFQEISARGPRTLCQNLGVIVKQTLPKMWFWWITTGGDLAATVNVFALQVLFQSFINN